MQQQGHCQLCQVIIKQVRDILLPVVRPDAYRERKSPTFSSYAASLMDDRSASRSHRLSESGLNVSSSHASNRTVSLDRTKSLSSNTVLKQQRQQQQLGSYSPAYQSKLDKLIKKLLKAGVDGDLGMVKFLLHWNQPSKDSTNNDTSVPKKSVTCHPLCECDNCIKTVSTMHYCNAVFYCCIMLLLLSLLQKLNVNSCDSDGFTLLHQACLHGHRRLVELVIEHDADVNAVTTQDRLTPLHYVCQYNHKDVCYHSNHKQGHNPYQAGVICVHICNDYIIS